MFSPFQRIQSVGKKCRIVEWSIPNTSSAIQKKSPALTLSNRNGNVPAIIRWNWRCLGTSSIRVERGLQWSELTAKRESIALIGTAFHALVSASAGHAFVATWKRFG
jgi:hypothetical protein